MLYGLPWTPQEPPEDPRGVCSNRGDNFRLGDLFYPLFQEKIKLAPLVDPPGVPEPSKGPPGRL